MRKSVIAFLLFAHIACGRSLEKQVQKEIQTFDHASLRDKQIEVKNVQVAGDEAVAEVQITTAVRLRRQDSRWIIEEFRIGDRHWERAEHILAVLEERRAQTTARELNYLSEGIRRYSEAHGQVPQVPDIAALIDVLSPQFLAQVSRLDAWSNPFHYGATGSNTYDLRSAGGDGQIGTGDDIVAGSE